MNADASLALPVHYLTLRHRVQKISARCILRTFDFWLSGSIAQSRTTALSLDLCRQRAALQHFWRFAFERLLAELLHDRSI